MRPQPRRLQLVVSNPSPIEKLSEVKCRMLSASLPASQKNLPDKLRDLQALRPAAVEVIERLVDDLLAEVS